MKNEDLEPIVLDFQMRYDLLKFMCKTESFERLVKQIDRNFDSYIYPSDEIPYKLMKSHIAALHAVKTKNPE